MLNKIKNAIDNLEIDKLYELATKDLKGVANKISIRQLGRRRIEKLYTYLVALDRDQLAQNHAFEYLLLNAAERELKKKGGK